MSPLPRSFRRLYASSATSNLADGVGRTALPLLAAATTRDPILVSGLVSFAYLPWLLFALPGGALVDRTDRRHAMAGANLVRALGMAALAALVLTHSVSIVALYAVAFVLGAAETVYDSASRAILPQVVAAADLDRANGALTVEETLGQTFLGAPLGSALFSWAAALPVLLNTGGFAVAALLVVLLPGSYRARTPQATGARASAGRSLRRDMAVGVRWLVGHRFLRTLTILSAVTGLLQSMTTGVFVLYVLDELRLPPGDFGLIFLAAGVGALAGGLATPRLVARLRRGPLLVTGAVLSAVALGAMGLTRNGYVAGGLFAASAAGIMVWNVLTMSLRQALIPQHLFGRVQGAYRTLVWGAIPLGALAGGALADRVGVRPVFVLAGGGLLAAAGCLAVVVARFADLLADEVDADAVTTDLVAADG